MAGARLKEKGNAVTNTFFVRGGIADTRSVPPRHAIHSSLVLCESYKTHQSDLRSDSPIFRCI